MTRAFAAWLTWGLLAACGHRASPAWLERPYAAEPATPQTRVMLVAGGDDVANFAHEVDAQRRMWRQAGVDDDAIACYWAKPRGRALAKDRRQYESLARAMAPCGAATAANVLDDLERIAENPPAYLYLYVTAHGVPSLGEVPGTWALPPEERALLLQPALALDGDPRLRLQHPANLLQAVREGTPANRVLLSPVALRDALALLPASTRKIVVLQGCFSGGFLQGEGSLATLPNTVVLTAAAAHRPSFGCGSGTRETFWGGALGRTLRKRVRRGSEPDALPWLDIYREVARRVRHLERALGQRASQPQFVDTAIAR